MGGWHPEHYGSREGSPRNNQGRLSGGDDMPTDCGKSGYISETKGVLFHSFAKTNGAKEMGGT